MGGIKSLMINSSPVKAYPKHATVGLHRDDLADQMRRFAGAFNLGQDVLHSTTIRSTSYDPERKKWTLTLSPSGKGIECKHIVLCTGIGSWAPHVPEIPGLETYQGVAIHSADFKNGRELAARGVKVSLKSFNIGHNSTISNGDF